MTNYWAIAPWPNKERQIFEQVWQYDREHGTIAIRWHQLGDLSGLSLAQIGRLYQRAYSMRSAPGEKMLWDFYNKIQIEDVVVARRGRKFCIGTGRVIRTAYFDLTKGRERLDGLASPYLGASFIEVEWDNFDIIPVSELFTMNTLSNIGEAKYRRLYSPGFTR